MVKTEIYGHRGMGCSTALCFSLYPENSLTAFSKALENGADGVEFDVFLTDLNEVVICHGHKPMGSAYISLLYDNAGTLELFPRDLSVENFKISHKNVVLKAPWTYKGAATSDEMAQLLSQLTDDEKEQLTEEYVTSTVGYVPEGSSDYERLATLEEVFTKFGDKLKYNVELKGTKTQLGLEVLKIVKKFSNLNVLISSFAWIAPPMTLGNPANTNASRDRLNEVAGNMEYRPTQQLEADLNQKLEELRREDEEKMKELEIEKDPNKFPFDLLECLICNELKIPLGLLFMPNESLPSVERLLEIVGKYKASFVNVSDSFWLKKKPILNSELKLENSLNYLVKQMHMNNVKVLTWSSSPFDFSKHFHVYPQSNVDVVCCNNVVDTVAFHKQYYSK